MLLRTFFNSIITSFGKPSDFSFWSLAFNISSKLDEVKGIGKNRRKLLLETFNSLDEILNASDQKLKSLGLPNDVIIELKKVLSNTED